MFVPVVIDPNLVKAPRTRQEKWGQLWTKNRHFSSLAVTYGQNC